VLKITLKMKTYNILSIQEFKTIVGDNSRLLGIDPGKTNVGIAICDENKKVATPIKIIKKKKLVNLVDEINKIINDNHIKGIVIGNPINMDGSVGKSSKSALEFAKNLSKNIRIPIVLWDERLSSVGAFKITSFLGDNVTNRVKNLDKNAAAFILQGAIDYLNIN
jgi:putative Holliday junction resolvase